MGRGLTGAGLAVIIGLVWLTSLGPLGIVLALSLGTVTTLLIGLGHEKLGFGFLILAFFMAPMNAVRPIAGADFVTFSDLFLLLGAGLLVPLLLRSDFRKNTTLLAGGALIVIAVLTCSLISPDATTSINYGSRLIAAAVVLPGLFVALQPSQARTSLMAAGYVAGHLVSTLYAVAEGAISGNRYNGLATHYNFFGLAAVVSIALLVHLYFQASMWQRWLVGLATLGCLVSIVLSGSRAAALVVVMIALVFPALEKSVTSALLIVVGSLTAFAVGVFALARGSVFTRLQGDATTRYSDNLRAEVLDDGIDRFLNRPLVGNGFDDSALFAHNIYVEVAAAAGIIGLIGFLLVLVACAKPLVTSDPMRRLAYVALAYAGIGMITNSLWDRFVWIAIALAIGANSGANTRKHAHGSDLKEVPPLSSSVP